MKALRIATVFLLVAGCLLLASCDKADTLAVKGLNFDELTAVDLTPGGNVAHVERSRL